MSAKEDVPYYENTSLLQKNENFFNYYIHQKIINEDEVENFMTVINTELPITFRVLNNNKYSNFIHENIKKKLEHLCKDNYAITKLNEWDQMYEIYLTRSQIKKDENYKNLYNYLINLNESGYIFRQELVSMLPVLFLKLKENYFVLDMCAAPGSKTAQIVDYMHLISKRNVKNYLIRKFIQRNSSPLSGSLGGVHTSEGEGNANLVDDDSSLSGDDSIQLGNGSSESGIRLNNNHENTPSDEKNNLYRSLHDALDGNQYDDEFFKYILNADNHLYGHYKELISNSNPTGVVIANDANFKRCCMLFHRLKNIHSNCLVVTNNNAINFPYIYMKDDEGNTNEKRYFDSVLCDVPCSGDGTVRKDRNIWLNWNPFNAYNLFQMQVSILKRSIELTKEGGNIVYSTCSLNPIENEAVICEVFNSVENRNCLKLMNFGNELIDKLNFKQGITEWKVMMDDQWFDTYEEYCSYLQNKEHGKYKKIYDKIQQGMFTPGEEFMNEINLKYVKRFFPHHYNAGGFFIAVIKKCGKPQWKEEKKKKKKKIYTKLNKADKDEYRKKYKYRRHKKGSKKKDKGKNGNIIPSHEVNKNCTEQNGNTESMDGVVYISDYVSKQSRESDQGKIFSSDNNLQMSKSAQAVEQNDLEDNYNVIGIDDVMTSYNVVTSNEVTNKYNLIDNDNLSSNYNMIDSDDMVRSFQPVRRHGGDVINLINRRSEEALRSYIGGEVDSTSECKVGSEGEEETEGEKEEKVILGSKNDPQNEEAEGAQREERKMTKQQEYVSLEYYEKLRPTHDLLNRVKNYFNLNDNFMSIKNNLYIHLKDDSNFAKLSIDERINVNIKKINLVSKHTKDILECYTKIKLKIISAGITVIQIDKNKKNGVENYYRINYSGCLNFLPFFKEVDTFLLDRTCREEIIKSYFAPVYENDQRVFDFEGYMNQLIGERKSTLSRAVAKAKAAGEAERKADVKEEDADIEAEVKKEGEAKEENQNEARVEKTEEPITDHQEGESDVNTIWVKSDAILDLIKVDKSKINNITKDTIRQTAKLTKHSPNILLTLNRNKQILAIPANKGNLFVDISIDKNSIIMLPYILN
ncbi:NOL1/NOP2/sun family methyltransferase [Plasmodium knowlesi strain H]|uniref:NOL1/NOP2/sun family methyltransferase n=3 Tax=Plasmodium knowlesi TaxID=5850 RepID=A0A5K1VGJ5_PLAKH|nr:NOL1/NOP2/sun family methyltransferase [Plasmodium knowlesi strain H]OTN68642.1 NOL1/NOP2/sun family methyltransferase [Plasmodium knowlesi]CAA9986108.1 NOL1/NOP2/sun family methyltransferase [Plasmodium knowlesi strain H]SBO25269.1 NOL1/NOP2/sun family methyltransferase [Plasmodium knowlesi strain H]SBO27604.1 NOL1/NOP2/sun family methyltransferase [Plasmodium knowlesi strain H]VVS75582.1 NOL1/NOP2/sun family methyltransferase [Plasmodium knowlesi strain H]|eukprot:XP_002257519.1 NOL1/NOP2/sun family methyltransferase [Plasmodium knowlesi strain H]